MGCYSVPAYQKPMSKITSWVVPMAFVDTERLEYIAEAIETGLVFKDNLPYYKDYMLLVMSKDLRGLAERLKVYVNTETRTLIPIQEFVNLATNEEQFGKATLNLNLLDESAYKEIGKVYNLLDRDVRTTIATPTQWLVYHPKAKLLTRLCWVVRIEGEVVIRPYGMRGLLLEVEKVEVEDIEKPSLKILKKHGVIKQRINDYWRRLVAMEEGIEELEELQGLIQYSRKSEGKEEERTEGVEVGEVE